jgi:hypothetical protein
MKKTILNQSKWHQMLFFGVLFLLSGSITIGQTISGKVSAANDEALPGVNVVIKGTTINKVGHTISVVFIVIRRKSNCLSLKKKQTKGHISHF